MFLAGKFRKKSDQESHFFSPFIRKYQTKHSFNDERRTCQSVCMRNRMIIDIQWEQMITICIGLTRMDG